MIKAKLEYLERPFEIGGCILDTAKWWSNTPRILYPVDVRLDGEATDFRAWTEQYNVSKILNSDKFIKVYKRYPTGEDPNDTRAMFININDIRYIMPAVSEQVRDSNGCVTLIHGGAIIQPKLPYYNIENSGLSNTRYAFAATISCDNVAYSLIDLSTASETSLRIDPFIDMHGVNAMGEAEVADIIYESLMWQADHDDGTVSVDNNRSDIESACQTTFHRDLIDNMIKRVTGSDLWKTECREMAEAFAKEFANKGYDVNIPTTRLIHVPLD